MRRFRRWWSEPVERLTPGFIALLAVLYLALIAGGAWIVLYAVETGNGHVLPIILAFLVAGLADLVRRAWRSGKPR
jgi:hypothetical protein